jgi:hypothetical protein
MSVQLKDQVIHIDSVDVKECHENLSRCETISDSGVSNVDSSSTAYAPSSDSDTSPTKSTEDASKVNNFAHTENDIDSLLSSPVSISPDMTDLIDNISCDKDYRLTEKDIVDSLKKSLAKKPDDSNKNVNRMLESDLHDKNNISLTTTSCDNVSTEHNVGSALNSSTVSLNEQIMPSINNNMIISKSPYSRSAENISSIDQNTIKTDKKSSNNDINVDEVLTEFKNKKNQVTATQKIPDPTQGTTDQRYARLPKELLHQDLGSIVKNVHGIFSTMSGSLKNAYNNSHRITMQKAPAKHLKPITNGTVMNYIFESESPIESTPEKVLLEKPNVNVEPMKSITSDLKSECESSESESDSKNDVKLHIEKLERLLAEQRKENSSLRDLAKLQLDEIQEKDQKFKDLESKLDLVSFLHYVIETINLLFCKCNIFNAGQNISYGVKV